MARSRLFEERTSPNARFAYGPTRAARRRVTVPAPACQRALAWVPPLSRGEPCRVSSTREVPLGCQRARCRVSTAPQEPRRAPAERFGAPREESAIGAAGLAEQRVVAGDGRLESNTGHVTLEIGAQAGAPLETRSGVQPVASSGRFGQLDVDGKALSTRGTRRCRAAPALLQRSAWRAGGGLLRRSPCTSRAGGRACAARPCGRDRPARGCT